MEWTKAKTCESSTCVEVLRWRDMILVRDSKQDEGPILRFSVQEWRAFAAGIRDGDFDSVAL